MLCLLWSVLPFYAAQVDTLMVKSPSMNKEVQVVVVVPDIALGKKGVDCPVIYLLHGFGGNAKTWIGIRPELPQIADEKGMKLAVIGGKAIYDSYLPVADILYVTYLDTDFMGDVLMPPVDQTVWIAEEIASGRADADNDYDWRIVKYTRR